jgi:hypothetical protein
VRHAARALCLLALLASGAVHAQATQLLAARPAAHARAAAPGRAAGYSASVNIRPAGAARALAPPGLSAIGVRRHAPVNAALGGRATYDARKLVRR